MSFFLFLTEHFLKLLWFSSFLISLIPLPVLCYLYMLSSLFYTFLPKFYPSNKILIKYVYHANILYSSIILADITNNSRSNSTFIVKRYKNQFIITLLHQICMYSNKKILPVGWNIIIPHHSPPLPNPIPFYWMNKLTNK